MIVVGHLRCSHLHCQVGIRSKECRQLRDHMKAGERGRNGHTDEPLRRRLTATDARRRALEVVENAQSRLVEVAACLRECNRTRGAIHQLGSELILQRGELFADGRLTNTTFFCDSGKAPFLHDPDEHLHCLEPVHSSPPVAIPLWNGLCLVEQNESRSPCEDNNHLDLGSLRQPSRGLFLSTKCSPIWNGWYSAMCQIR